MSDEVIEIKDKMPECKKIVIDVPHIAAIGNSPDGSCSIYFFDDPEAMGDKEKAFGELRFPSFGDLAKFILLQTSLVNSITQSAREKVDNQFSGH